MISVTVNRNESGRIVSFSVRNHGESYVCAAVSMLVFNTVNSIDLFTDDGIAYQYDEEECFFEFTITDRKSFSSETSLLLDSMFLGLVSAKKEHPEEIEITERREEND